MLQLAGRTTLASDVANVLRDAIVTGYFAAGERLIESSLADELEISRTTLREALRVLSSEGLIITEPHRGSHVVELSREDMREIYEMRLALESMAATKVCGHLSKNQVKRLRSLIEQMKEASRNGDALTINELDMKFHETICQFANNARLWKFWKQMGGQMRLYFAAFQGKIQLEEIAQRHEAILDVLISGPKEEASRIFEHHIGDAASRILEGEFET